jgi:hypothetical protein
MRPIYARVRRPFVGLPLVEQVLADVVRVPFREVRRHQPDQVAGAEPPHPSIRGQPAGDKQCEEAKQVGEKEAEAYRLALLRDRQLVGERRNAEHVVDRQQTFENDESGNDGEAGKKFRGGHRTTIVSRRQGPPVEDL